MLTWARWTAMAAVMSVVATTPVMAQGMVMVGGGGVAVQQMKGPASPPDIVYGRLSKDADVLIAYSRPFKKGRTIFGGLVPWDQVWRTGANAATTLVTGKDLVIGGTTIPAGTYTLYTLPSQSGWKLIVNKQVTQWGTEYNQDQDLARIPMTVTTLSAPVEEFTMSVAGNMLKLDWDTTEASVQISAK